MPVCGHLAPCSRTTPPALSAASLCPLLVNSLLVSHSLFSCCPKFLASLFCPLTSLLRNLFHSCPGHWSLTPCLVSLWGSTPAFRGCSCAFGGFPASSAGKESTCNAGDLGSIPGLGRSAGEGNGYPLQYSGLEDSMDCIVHGVAKIQMQNFPVLFGSSHLSVQGKLVFPTGWCRGWEPEPWGQVSLGSDAGSTTCLGLSTSQCPRFLIYKLGMMMFLSS